MIDKHELLAIGNARLRRHATFASISVASILIIIKFIAYLMTDSVSVLSSLLDSTFDLVASLVTAYGVYSALKPADHNHRYGHGKAEPLAVLAQGVFIIGSSVLLVYEAASRLYHPHEIQNEMIGYIVMGVSIFMTIGLVWFQHHVVHETGSMAVGADRLHYIGDLAVNIAVVAAFLLHQFTSYAWFDPIFALAIAAGLFASAIHILKQALFNLMDEELPEAQRNKIRDIVLKQPGVHGVHDMRTRSDSDRIFVELHVEMDGDTTLIQAHELSDRIINAVVAKFPHADIVIHQDPAGLEEDRRDIQIAKRAEFISSTR